MIYTVKGFGVINKAEVDVLLELSCFFYDSVDVGSLISGSSAFSKSSFNIWKFMFQVLLQHGLENFENYFARVWDFLFKKIRDTRNISCKYGHNNYIWKFTDYWSLAWRILSITLLVCEMTTIVQ